jgi:DNA-binding SARP family transcriptional activator
MPQLLDIRLLGAFHLCRNGEAVGGFDQARLQELLVYLILRRGASVPRQHLAFLFWPDSTEEQARTNLRNLWHRLRRHLPDAADLLTASELALQWRGDASCRVDLAQFEAELANARASENVDERIAALERAVALYGGDLLPGCYSEWLLAERDRVAGAYGDALEQLATLHEERGEYRRAIAHAQALLRCDPLNESAYAQLMRLHALNEDRAAALHTYHTCASVLRRELDVEPGAATRALYERLVNFAPEPARPAPGDAVFPLVGREAEWAQLQEAWRKAAGRPRAVVISGDVGIGKTRLAEALGEWVARQGIPALTARCYAAGGDLAYAPVVAWLRGAPRPALPEAALRELSRLLPEISNERPDLPLPEPLSEKWQRLRLFETLSQALLAGRSQLLLALDDLQWSDPDTLDWLHYLITGPPTPRGRGQLLLVATCLCEEHEDNARIEAWKADLSHSGQFTEIALGPLTLDATLALADRVAGRRLDPALASALYRGTEGHPLFIVEMVRARASRADAETAEHALLAGKSTAALPEKVRRVLAARLGQLSPAARAVVEAASVVGRAFTFDVLALAAELDERELVASLDEAWRRHIIREQGANAYDFSHDKLRDAAYEGLSGTRRRWLHGRVAQALERLHEDDLDRAAAPIAEHYEAAGQAMRASGYFERAARFARGIYAHEDALAALESGIALLRDSPGARATLARLQEQRGDILLLRAQHAEAREAYQAALACLEPRDSLGEARLRRKTGKTLEDERAPYERVAAEYGAAEALLGPPNVEREQGWWEEWCQVQLEHLLLLYWWNLPGEMAGRIALAQPLIESHGTPYQKATLYSNLARAETRQNRLAPTPSAVKHLQHALATLPPTAAPLERATHRFELGFYLLWNGDYVEAEQSLAAALSLAEHVRDVTLQARCLAYLTVVSRRQAREAATEGYARRALKVAQTAGPHARVYTGTAYAGLAWLAERRGNLAEAERLGQSAVDAFAAYGAPYPLYWQAYWPLLAVALAEGRLDDAARYAQGIIEPSQQPIPPEIEAPLRNAVSAWEHGDAGGAHEGLGAALCAARTGNFN